MRKQGAMLSALVLLGALPLLQQTKAPNKHQGTPSGQQAANAPLVIPPEAAKKVNPVKPTEKSIAAGKKLYGIDCVMCHGADGSGKTDLAVSMKLVIPDLRDPSALKSVTDGGLFYVISSGHSSMPGESARAKPEQIWNLVNYVRTLSEKKTAHK